MLKEIFARIDVRRQEMGIAELEDLARQAGHGVSTWHAWRRDNRPTSPKFLDLRDFALVVGLEFRLLPKNGAVDTVGREVGDMTDEALRLARMLDDMIADRGMRQKIVGVVQGIILSERMHAPDPSEPAGETGDPDRVK